MTKSERATLWFKNCLKRREIKETEEHVRRVSMWVIGASFMILLVLFFINR